VWFKEAHGPRFAPWMPGNDSEQLKDVFSVADSPIWMDIPAQVSSVPNGKRRLGAAPGGCRTTDQGLREVHGEPDSEDRPKPAAGIRGDGPDRAGQFIHGIAADCDYAPIDAADSSGMNLMDLRQKAWRTRSP